MGCKKLALYPGKTTVTWHVRAFGEHKKIHVNWYDYGARFYDAEIARFHTIDPLTEMFTQQSPYVYAANNPVRYVDVLGMYAGEAGKWDSDDPEFEKVLAYWGISSSSSEDKEEKNEEKNNRQKLESSSIYLIWHEAGGSRKRGNAVADELIPEYSYEGMRWRSGMPKVVEDYGKTLVVCKETNRYVDINDPTLARKFNKIINEKPFGSSRYHPVNTGIGRTGTKLMYFISNMLHLVPVEALGGSLPTTENINRAADNYDKQRMRQKIKFYRKEGLIE